MILSGVAAQALELEKSQIQQQLWCVRYSRDGPKWLRLATPHLRLPELEGKGMEMIFRELKEKSNLTVVFKHNEVEHSKDMEEHLFQLSKKLLYLETR